MSRGGKRNMFSYREVPVFKKGDHVKTPKGEGEVEWYFPNHASPQQTTVSVRFPEASLRAPSEHAVQVFSVFEVELGT